VGGATVLKVPADVMVTVLDRLLVTVCKMVEVVTAPGVAETESREEPATVDVPIDVRVSGQTVVETGITAVTIEGAALLRGQLVTLSGQWKTVK
jgi:hypothetical protein